MAYSPPISSRPAAPINTKTDRLALPAGAGVSDTPAVATTNGAIATLMALVGARVGGTAEGSRVACATANGVAALGVSSWLASRLPPLAPAISPMILPVALFTMITGLFLIVSRRQALTQVIGYLALENGIFAFGLGLVREAPVIVEMGILLDIFVAVFVMGITIFHISREFDQIDTEQLTALKDTTS
jgi:hypothetical protein